MSFQIKILLMSFLATVVFSILVIPILKKLKVGQIERDDGPESHLDKQGTPTMGGVIIAIAITLISIFLIWDYSKDDIKTSTRLIPILLVTIGFGVVGLIDDTKKVVFKNTEGLKPAYKMIGLLAIAVIYIIYLVNGLKLETRNIYPIF